ncbi:hypothetical protein [Herbaspirillum frisingense]|uniref:hypothetical protein n=1 Tax=Herbaspirillum frisingense TaxID=92645 RepID=UPI001F1BD02A|nr:hypothetical protein [Herbaspirillum frisingense]UIN23509.1 hypothetical protein LAZ82_10605 [Herbaspirillum frisingense]
MLNSPAYRVIGFAAKALFFDLRDKLTGTNNGTIVATLGEMRHKGWASSATLAKALYELRAMGFIAVTVEGGLKQRQRTPSLYRFTDLPVLDQPKSHVQAIGASHDYLRFATVREAEKALTVLFSELQESGRKKQIRKNLPVQNLNCASSENELKEDFFSSGNEQVVAISVQKLNTGSEGGKSAKAR